MCCASNHQGQPQTSFFPVNDEYGDQGECTCTGDDSRGYCCGYATDADGLCDRCRKHCKVESDPNGNAEPAVSETPHHDWAPEGLEPIEPVLV